MNSYQDGYDEAYKEIKQKIEKLSKYSHSNVYYSFYKDIDIKEGPLVSYNSLIKIFKGIK